MFFFDEGRFGTNTPTGRIWAEKGKTPITYVKPGYENFYTYAGVSPLTGEDFILFLPEVNTEMMNLYLEKFSECYPEEKILLILDCAGWHRSKALKVPKNIELLYLPPYTPELNPVEKLWLWFRRHVCRNRIFETLEELMEELEKFICSLSPELLLRLCRVNYL